MAYVAVLDANVLYGQLVRDLLLRLAERRLFRPVWSRRILDEVFESIASNRPDLDPSRLARTRRRMEEAFEEAMIGGVDAFLAVVPREVEPGDRHVVATALAAKADCIVTDNDRHFAPDALWPLGIEVQRLDTFLVNQWALDPELVLGALNEMVEDYTRPKAEIDVLLDWLEERAPAFVAEIRRALNP